MDRLSERTLKIIRNAVFLVGVAVGFLLWYLLPDFFTNTAFFHVGNGKYGSKYGALILLLLPTVAFIPTDNSIEEVHTDDLEERAKLEAENRKKLLKLQVGYAIAMSILVWLLMGGAVLFL